MPLCINSNAKARLINANYRTSEPSSRIALARFFVLACSQHCCCPKISAQMNAPCTAPSSDSPRQMIAGFYLHIHKTSVNLRNVRSSYLALDEQTCNVFRSWSSNGNRARLKLLMTWTNQFNFKALTGTSSQELTVRKVATQPCCFCSAVKFCSKDSWQSCA